jgi:DMSO/TMAO reductase YedYZ molybdopterin-dependent catalytic subunit
VAQQTVELPFGNGTRPMVAYAQKRKLIGLTSRPPQLATSFGIFNESLLTPNDAFFVRYHLSNLPYESIDPETFRLTVSGAVRTPLSLSLAEIKAMPQVEIVAVAQCSGKSRGLFVPCVAGGQAGNGMMGNARWRGTPLKGVLERAGIKPEAVEVQFDGMDGPVLPETPDFAKSLQLDHAGDGEVMLAWAMNGADLPFLNGYPLRLVVPGHYATYWVKHLNAITVLDKPLANFWMATAYRIPDNDCACVAPGAAPDKTRPIGRYNVRSFITSVQDGARLAANSDITVKGIAFDGGSGIRLVEISSDGGANWKPAALGEDMGKFAFRGFSLGVRLPAGRHKLLVRATSNAGETQPAEPRRNASGYMRNVIETITVTSA